MVSHKITVTQKADKRFYFCDGVRISRALFLELSAKCFSKSQCKTECLKDGVRITFYLRFHA